MKITCRKCGEEKEHSPEFFKTNKVGGKVYLERVCKVCRNKGAEISKRKRYQNPDYLKTIIEKRKDYHKKHYQEHIDWYKERDGRLRDHYNKLERERYYPKNGRARYLRRWANPTYRVSKLMSNRIRGLIKDKDFDKTFLILGYSVNDVMKRLESKFRDGMTWDNYGKFWHIDHIKPVSHFSFTSKEDEDFKKCWALENLQPLLKSENLSKGNRFIG